MTFPILPTGRDLAEGLFHTKRSRAAGRAFLDWFRAKEGRATRSELNAFAVELRGGIGAARLSKGQFYELVGHLLDNGLVRISPEMDPDRKGRVREVYRHIVQPIPKRRPEAPSLVYNVHLFAEAWNAFFDQAQPG